MTSSGSQRQNWRAISSSSTLVSEYVDSGRGAYSSSRGAYGGGVSKGRPSTVSLEAHTTCRMPAARQAANTLYVAAELLAKVAAFGSSPGAGMAARCTTASTGPCSSAPPDTASTTWP